MRARGILATTIVVAMAVNGLAGCTKKLRPIENRPPETYVFVQGPVDTVNHRVHLYWYGTDPDGNVVAYTFRWVYPPPAPQDPAWDTVFSAKLGVGTDSMFTMFTGDSAVVSPRFEVYAIDNEGKPDPTPAVQTFWLSNRAPEVVITEPLGLTDTTYASVTVAWETIDPDGGGPGLHYRIWMDGNQASYDSTSERTFTVPSARFLQNSTYKSGRRTLYIQAVDDGGRSGPPSTMTWYVKAPAAVLENNQGRLLVIDEVPTGGQNNALLDGFYGQTIPQLLPAGTYSVLHAECNYGGCSACYACDPRICRIFRSARDFAQTLRQFKAVLWYRGGEATVSPWLRDFQDSLGVWLDGGGKLYLDGLYLVEGLNTAGALREEFLRDRLGSTGLFNCYANVRGAVKDSTAGWGFHSGPPATAFRSSVYRDSLYALADSWSMSGLSGGVRGFVVTDTNFVVLWALEGQQDQTINRGLDPPNVGFQVPVGVTVPQGMNGRIVLMSIPLRYCQPAPATRILQRILTEFGVIP